jgi:uncharacterized protein (DUF1015 family)
MSGSEIPETIAEAHMAEIQPFRAFRYDTNRVALNDVLTQPYDKITPAMQDRYCAASPYNLIAVEKGRIFPEDTATSNVYTRASKTIGEWIAKKILVQDEAPCLYVYAQEFSVPGSNTRRVRLGYIALVRVEDYDAHVIFRHERTLSGPKADRMELLRQTRAQTGQLFLLFDDPAQTIDKLLEKVAHEPAPNEMKDEYGVTHRLWPVADAALIHRVQNEMAAKKLIIADGHHRYETALNYRNECRGRLGKPDPFAAHEFAMATFINTHSKGLVILPTHRVVRNLSSFDFARFRDAVSPYFDWYAYPFATATERDAAFAEFRKDFESHTIGRRAIGIYAGGGAFYLFLLRRHADLHSWLPGVSSAQLGLDVVLLHRLVLEKGLGISAESVEKEKNITYEREMDAALAALDRGEAQLACMLNPVRIQQVADIALGGDVLPQKSTDFYPKMLSGLAIFRIEGRLEGQLEGPAVGQPGEQMKKRAAATTAKTSKKPKAPAKRRAKKRVK